MLLSMSQEYLSTKVGDKEAFRLIKEAGFDAVDYSMFYMRNDDNVLNSPDADKYITELKEYADSIGLKINQSHSPFPAYKKGDEEFSGKMLPRVKKSIRFAAMLGAPHIVVHPIYEVPDGEELFEYNIKFFNDLKTEAEKYNVKIAVENTFGYDPKRDVIMPNVCSFPEDIHRYLDALGDEWFIACLDTGHCTVVGTEPEISIRALGGKRLRALHIHDNDYRGDHHRLPYTGKTEWNSVSINWDNVTKAISDIGYEGDFTFETDESVLRGYDIDFYPTVLKFMHDTGRYLMKKINI